MKRPLKPVKQTSEERVRVRRFTRRMMILAVAGGLLGSCVNLVTRTMGKPAQPRLAGAVAAPQSPPGK
jgi:hypothetical protein